ncbi:glycyl-tRNA synthetase beta chain [Desulfatibacillum alkenivorans DSM 16219]|jgi:glycyl-tRNA synthetase beta chain|uniref:Glycine--tRNA ligase beta subunit n=1 Tax=Desulfatibacillum alkenivorans DSM 16219 TaxID=1121393 RepID=A0A1M7A8Z9_9BACT|nr:glycine--tRNA ligase subunit beta [Desulfatibacillum alkenivorans]SHL39181.1 glycyl-tRNA synthetase beta chain [Desulfatibacillum alkenivorans DSM 16219]
MQPLLLEIGSEEIPAGYIVPALEALAQALDAKLESARIAHSKPKVYGTPRRLAVILDEVAEKQESVTTEMVGPPKSVAFDDEGKPKVPAVKFAEKAGVAVEELRFQETEKGVYLCAKIQDEGKETLGILQEMLPEIISHIPFPKSMRWAALPGTFARPVFSILALLGDQVIPFEWNGVTTGRQTRGHYFMAPGAIDIQTPSEYVDALEKAKVIADIPARRQMVKEGVDAIAKELGGEAIEDEELVDIVANLVEFPAPVGGKFETGFLEVPDKVLITAMREHQKYFAIQDKDGKLMPCFVAVNNTQCKDPQLVATGHERVLRARLSDAKFFWDVDKKQSMEDWVKRLDRVLFQKKLGSVGEKVARVEEMAKFLAAAPEIGGDPEKAQMAAHFCKADLVSGVVIEFTKLQGVMGKAYASLAGMDAETASALEEHYLPAYSGGPLPRTKTGDAVAMADKMDSLCGCFAVGLIPSGNRDPYALRRQGIGVIRILQEKGYSLSLGAIVDKGLELVKDKADQDLAETREKVVSFLADRMAHMLSEQGFSKDVIQAAVAISCDDVPYLWKRVAAVEKLKTLPDYEALAQTFKRVANIIKQAAEKGTLSDQKVDPALFEKDCEKDLLEAFTAMEAKVSGLGVDQALLEVAKLRPAVDAFFDDVMVMAEDMKVRENRLALLAGIAGLFGRFADFSRISA